MVGAFETKVCAILDDSDYRCWCLLEGNSSPAGGWAVE